MRDHYIFWHNSYLQTDKAIISEITDEGIILQKTLFQPIGGGQPSDTGFLDFENVQVKVISARKLDDGQVLLQPESLSSALRLDMSGTQIINWEDRYKYMRMHTALHLLSVVIPFPVNGGQIGLEKSRLDFDMPEPLEDKDRTENELNSLISDNSNVEQIWISENELSQKPSLVKTMSVSPPKGAGDVRLIKIASLKKQIDLQPCGGTHVKKTGEVGKVLLGKVEKKGRNNRRINLYLEN